MLPQNLQDVINKANELDAIKSELATMQAEMEELRAALAFQQECERIWDEAFPSEQTSEAFEEAVEESAEENAEAV